MMLGAISTLCAVAHNNIVIIEIGAGCKVGGVRYTSQSVPGTLIGINTRDVEELTEPFQVHYLL
ncbi:MAG: hypothetical protein D4R63_12260 [Methylococcaceae bacterium]|nr:MAG: hypothetical protein D4R63_12260 [Methylococcaceae bacterium]